jgi:hypothetical protein
MPHPPGAQYLLRLRTTYPGVPHVAAYTALSVEHAGMGGQSMIFPLDNDVQGRVVGEVESSSGKMYLQPTAFISGSRSEPSHYLYRQLTPSNPRRYVSFLFQFLEGNALFPDPPLQFSSNTMNYTTGFDIFWSLTGGGTSTSTRHTFSPPFPVGPVIVDHGIEGYTSDTLKWNAKYETGTFWNALILPESADFEAWSPDSRAPIGLSPPDMAIVRRALEWLLSGEVWHLSNIKPFADRNGDRVHDVADLLTLRVAGKRVDH